MYGATVNASARSGKIDVESRGDDKTRRDFGGPYAVSEVSK